ncbi:family 43 glycosylhydrolase [Micromonospora sp. NBS 11-29]|uniref:family 43 glycosylhydrolase n=1 Tax=Micromonospora sp. NBS 11-29 TaxID=1960879 RepID=UPI003F8E612A
MREWRVFSSADMVNWTDHGSPMSLATFAWADANAWAGQVVARNGKFYWYAPVRQRSNGQMVIGVGATTRSTPRCSSTTTARRTSTGATRTCGTCGSTRT